MGVAIMGVAMPDLLAALTGLARLMSWCRTEQPAQMHPPADSTQVWSWASCAGAPCPALQSGVNHVVLFLNTR